MSPEITVIVPAYNAEKYLRTCLESVTGQTFTSWELIIADDGSTDSTGAIADEYAAKDGRIKVLHLNRHGVSAARNACIDAANGKYLAYVDADDLLEPDYLKALYEKSEESNADIMQCSFFVDADGNKTPDTNPVDKTYEEAGSAIRAFFEGSHGDIRDSVWAKLFRREAFADIRFDTGLNIYEDGYYKYAVIEALEPGLYPICLTPIFYKWEGDSKTGGYKRIKRPAATKNFGGFTIG